jgi:hypothetical protein
MDFLPSHFCGPAPLPFAFPFDPTTIIIRQKKAAPEAAYYVANQPHPLGAGYALLKQNRAHGLYADSTPIYPTFLLPVNKPQDCPSDEFGERRRGRTYTTPKQ